MRPELQIKLAKKKKNEVIIKKITEYGAKKKSTEFGYSAKKSTMEAWPSQFKSSVNGLIGVKWFLTSPSTWQKTGTDKLLRKGHQSIRNMLLSHTLESYSLSLSLFTNDERKASENGEE